MPWVMFIMCSCLVSLQREPHIKNGVQIIFSLLDFRNHFFVNSQSTIERLLLIALF